MAGGREELEGLFAQMAVDRARALGPIVLLAITSALVISEPTSIPLPQVVVTISLVDLLCVAVLTAALFARKIPARLGHVASVALWWAPVVTTLTSFYFVGDTKVALLLLVEMAAGAMLLHAAWMIASFAIVDALWIAMIFRRDDALAGFYVTMVVTAQIVAFVMFVLMRRSLEKAEKMRLAEASVARQLAARFTELQKSEAEREKLTDQLLHVQRMEAVGTLAAGLAHDMNNVLAAILGFTEMLLEDATDDQAREDLRQVMHEAERGAELTRGLLAFSRRGQYRKQTLAVTRIVDDVIQLLGRTLPKAIQIKTELDVPDAFVSGDSTQLGQVLVNLGINAADAMSGSGTLVIAADSVELDEARGIELGVAPGEYVCVRVTDSGIGMDDATKKRVFEPFFTTKPQGKGTGLGLSLVWGAVHGHDGAVVIESAPGKGSTFSVYLPTCEPEAGVAIAPWASGRIHRRGTVLVVDDEPAVRRSVARMLERIGLTVVDAAEGEQALRVFDEHRNAIGLVILDMGMPVMDGSSCFHELRRRSQVPILIVTGYAAAEDAQKLVAAGAHLLEKPFNFDRLSREIESLMGPEFRRAS